MCAAVISVDYTIPGGLDWAENGEPEPLSIKYGDRVCAIERADPTVLILDKSSFSENTERYVIHDQRVPLPDGFRGRFCRFTELNGDTLCVFVMADDLQTCALYDWNTADNYAYGIIPAPLPANALLERVDVNPDNTMQLTYVIAGVSTTITVPV